MPSISIRIDEETKKLLEEGAMQMGIPLSSLIKDLIYQYLSLKRRSPMEEFFEKLNVIDRFLLGKYGLEYEKFKSKHLKK
ncbi:MAG: DUF6290 family protein [Candidatus Bathyarchaeia archaeon]